MLFIVSNKIFKLGQLEFDVGQLASRLHVSLDHLERILSILAQKIENGWSPSSLYEIDEQTGISGLGESLVKMRMLNRSNDTNNEEVQCQFCFNRLPRDQAIEEDWIPYFYDGVKEINHPVCQRCQRRYLNFNTQMGDFETQIIQENLN